MRKLTLAYLLVLFTVLASCQSTEKESHEIMCFDLQSGMNNPESMVLSDLVSEISYTPLETVKGALLGRVKTIVIAEDKYLLTERSREIKVFTFDGEYLHDIGKIGKGPGEYQDVRSLSWDQEKKEVLLYNIGNTSLQYYNLSGDFRRNIKVPHSPMTIYPLQSGKYLGWDMTEIKIDSLYCSVFQFDTVGQVKAYGSTQQSDPRSPEMYAMSSSFQLGELDLYIPERSDTIFHVLDGEMVPYYCLGIANKMIPAELYYDRDVSVEEKNKYIFSLSGHGLNDNEFVLDFRQGRQRYFAFCNVKTGSSKVIKVDPSGVVNDVDGGQPLKAFYFSAIHNGYFYTATSPIDMQSDLENKEHEPKATYKEFVEGLDPEDNTVIIKMKLIEQIL